MVIDFLVGAAIGNSLMALVLALAAAAAARVWPNRPRLAHGLWLLVLLKLATPPLIDLPLPPLGAAKSPAYLSLPAKNLSLSAKSRGPHGGAALDAQRLRLELSALQAQRADRASRWWWSAGLMIAWLSGGCLWLAVAAARIRRFDLRLRSAVPAPGNVQPMTNRLAERMKLTQTPVVLLVNARISPLVWCAWRSPVIVLPASLVEALPEDRLRLVLRHELVHIRRGDHVVRWLELIILSAYWWCPLSWWAVRELHRAEEHCCDEEVIEWEGLRHRRAYVETLVHVVDFLTGHVVAPPLASGMGSNPALKRRCEMIIQRRASRRLGGAARLTVLLTALFVLPFSLPVHAQQAGGAKVELESRIARLEELVAGLLESQRQGDKLAAEDAAADAAPSTTKPLDKSKDSGDSKTLAVDSQGRFYADEKPIETAALKALLKSEMVRNIIVIADPDTPAGSVQALCKLAAQCGVTSTTLRKRTTLRVNVDAKGVYSVRGAEQSLAAVQNQVRRLKPQLVRIAADRAVSYQKVVALINAVQAAGAKKLAFSIPSTEPGAEAR